MTHMFMFFRLRKCSLSPEKLNVSRQISRILNRKVAFIGKVMKLAKRCDKRAMQRNGFMQKMDKKSGAKSDPETELSHILLSFSTNPRSLRWLEQLWTRLEFVEQE